MLARIEGPYSEIAAVAPTRYQEHQDGGGYDVELPLALRIQLQYKAPKAHPERGVRFKLDEEQITTLAAREPIETAFYACPIVASDNQLADALDECYFVDAQAIRPGSSQLYIPGDWPNTGAQGKYKDPDDKRGWSGDPKNYYPIPDSAIKTWSDFKDDIESRNIGMTIQEQSSTTTDYRDFVNRLRDLWTLHDDTGPNPVQTDGGYDKEDRRAAINRLAKFAAKQQQYYYKESHVGHPDIQELKVYFQKKLDTYASVRRPDIHGLRRGQELVAQSGNPSDGRKRRLGH